MAEEQIIIDVNIDVEKARQNLVDAMKDIGDAKKRLSDLKDETENFTKMTKDQAQEYANLNKRIQENSRVVKSNTALLQAENTTILDTTASLNDQRAQLAQLQKAYASLSGEEKTMADASGGLRDMIKKLTEQVKEQESAIGDNRRNVGNYTESLARWSDAANITKGALEGLAGGSSKASKAADQLNKVTIAFSKNPILGVLAIIVTVLGALINKLKENEQQFREVQVATASLSGIFKTFEPIITKVAGILSNVLLKALEWVTNAIKKMLGALDKIGKWLGKDWNLAESFETAAEAAANAAKSTDSIATAATNATRAVKDLNKEFEKLEEQRRKIEENVLNRLFAMTEEIDEKAAREEEERAKLEKYLQSLRVLVEEDEEEGEDVPSIEEMVRNKFGLDEEAVEYFNKLMKEGVGYEQAAQKAMAEQTKRIVADVAKSLGSLGSSFTAMSEAMGGLSEQNEAAAKAQKAFAFAGILMSQAQSIADGAAAISAGVAQSQSVPFPANIAAIATTVAAITGVLASTISSFIQAKQIFAQADSIEAGKFATGGVVPGTSYTGDSMVAHVNSREGIFTVQQQKTLFDIANGRTPAFDYDALAGVLVAAMAAQPAPVLDLQEFHDFEDKVVTFDEYAKI